MPEHGVFGINNDLERGNASEGWSNIATALKNGEVLTIQQIRDELHGAGLHTVSHILFQLHSWRFSTRVQLEVQWELYELPPTPQVRRPTTEGLLLYVLPPEGESPELRQRIDRAKQRPGKGISSDQADYLRSLRA